ncbi:MAG: hypothetical protein K8R46_12605, partial [Pirellulales bacterium]|nr:hypothetical protein [Pirellulales bacterium]
ENHPILDALVFRIAFTTYADWVEQQVREQQRGKVPSEYLEQVVPDGGPGPYETAEARDFLQNHVLSYMEDRIARCDANFVALWLFTVEEIPAREVARILNTSENNVNVKVHRARKKLEEELGMDGTPL